MVAFIAASLANPLSGAESPPVFEKDVLPIFTQYCFNCHGQSSPQLGLDLRTARLAMRGSQNGPVIVKGSPEESLLWKKVSSREMPLKIFKLKMSDEEIETIRRWIAAGAPSAASLPLPAAVQQQLARFEEQIQPLLDDRCVNCHGADESAAGLDLSSLSSLVRGSDRGPVVVEGFSEKSVLIRKLASRAMPPEDADQPLTAAEINLIRRWIDRGRFADFVDTAPHTRDGQLAVPPVNLAESDRQFWAFQKPRDAALPSVRAVDRVRTPIDRFLLARLESQGLTFAPDASRRELLRRACFDLTGLPPTLAQRQAYLRDTRPGAYERLVDRLLASPAYGERWGRHWLDAVGYVDTTGKDFDPNNVALADGIWRYRDYVVQATNRDVPWDRFLIEQIAGDELVDWRKASEYTSEILNLLTATGYLRNVLDATDENISNLPFDRYEALFKLMERVSSSTLGLTLACARCHDHKFDPIPQTDYYRFLAVFTPAYNPSDWLPPKQRHLFNAPPPVQDEVRRQQANVSRWKQQLADVRERRRGQLLQVQLEAIPAVDRGAAEAAIKTAAAERTPQQKQLIAKYGTQLTVSQAEIDQAYCDAERELRQRLQNQIRTAEAYLAGHRLEKIQALWDVGRPPTIRLLHRGDVDFAGPIVAPGFLSVLSRPAAAAARPSPDAVGETSGLRLAWAQWLTDSDHPLTARVIVNRMWQHHFGRGIVATPDNFGASGSRPTHPQLLDWLALQFIRQGWSGKQFHRLVMHSTAYRQASSNADALERGRAIDPDNHLLWRMPLRRLDAEALRDAILSVSGRGDFAIGGPPMMLKATPTGLQTEQTPSSAGSRRRSIYLLARRSNPLTFLRTFDYPVIDVNCTRRATSATPLQSLTLINSEFLLSSAAALSRRIDRLVTTGDATQQKIATAYELVLARPPSAVELESAQTYLRQVDDLYGGPDAPADVPADARQQSFEHFVHMLLCSNEFLYLD